MQKQNYIISFVVDALPLHYYQAELLLYSLECFSKVSKKNILIQCLNRVDKVFLDFLEKNNYQYRIIPPYLDGKYCNKLQQLGVFLDVEDAVDGVILLDTDMFVLQPFCMADNNLVWGKVVDGPNPSLETLKNIFSNAGLDCPQEIGSDWGYSNNQTFSSNFNGGFYYIPRPFIKELNEEWRKWGGWLSARPELFETKQQAIHTDQVSISMAISALDLPYGTLASNGNCPIHVGKPQQYLNVNNDVSLLHYHREILESGLLNISRSCHEHVTNAIEKANDAIIAKNNFSFFEIYRKSLISKFNENEDVVRELFKSNLKLPSKPCEIIFHVGTPKTGTTSLQFFLNNKTDDLSKLGYLYPKNQSNTYAPKHQWIVNTLNNNNYIGFIEELNKSLEEFERSSGCHTIIFSTEGVFNHWWDFSQQTKEFLKVMVEYFDLKIWAWFREPVSFIESYYKQNLKNPQLSAVQCYGQDSSLLEMLNNNWFAKHLDYLGFILECESIFGKKNVHTFAYEGNIIPAACQLIGLNRSEENSARENIGLSNAGAELLRVVNRYDLQGNAKKDAVALVQKLDCIIDDNALQFISGSVEKRKIKSLVGLGQQHLNLSRYSYEKK